MNDLQQRIVIQQVLSDLAHDLFMEHPYLGDSNEIIMKILQERYESGDCYFTKTIDMLARILETEDYKPSRRFVLSLFHDAVIEELKHKKRRE